MTQTREIRNTGRKSYPSATLSTTFLQFTELVSSPGLPRLEADDKPLEPRSCRTPLKTLSKQCSNLWSLPHREHSSNELTSYVIVIRVLMGVQCVIQNK